MRKSAAPPPVTRQQLVTWMEGKFYQVLKQDARKQVPADLGGSRLSVTLQGERYARAFLAKTPGNTLREIELAVLKDAQGHWRQAGRFAAGAMCSLAGLVAGIMLLPGPLGIALTAGAPLSAALFALLARRAGRKAVEKRWFGAFLDRIEPQVRKDLSAQKGPGVPSSYRVFNGVPELVNWTDKPPVRVTPGPPDGSPMRPEAKSRS